MIKTEISFIPELLRKKQYALIIDEMRHRILSTSRFIGFQRDPHAPLEIPEVDLKLNVRPIQKSDFGTLFHLVRRMQAIISFKQGNGIILILLMAV